MVTVRQVGVEEELLLVDVATGDLRPVARQLVSACQPAHGVGTGALIKHEFFLSQLEIATRPHTAVESIREELAGARGRIAEVGAAIGVAPLAVPGPVLAPASLTNEISPDERYAGIEHHYGDVARQSLMCALHVHVEVLDDDEGVAVIDRVRPWIPVLLAISANSPYWHGRETGYESSRSRVWNMWPTSGPAELFGDADGYRKAVEDMVSHGAALDTAMVNLDVRLSHRYPTVEFRTADVCTDVDDAMLIAALARALVTHCAARWRAGDPAAAWRVEELRAAGWRAARFGLGNGLVSPVTRDLTDAGEVLQELRTLVAEPLELAGDSEAVIRGIAALQARGNGAAAQRSRFAATGDLAQVVTDIQRRTLRF